MTDTQFLALLMAILAPRHPDEDSTYLAMRAISFLEQAQRAMRLQNQQQIDPGFAVGLGALS